jgi:hypothetical protein
VEIGDDQFLTNAKAGLQRYFFAIIFIITSASHFVPAGQYGRLMNETLGKGVPLPFAYQQFKSDPHGFFDAVKAPIAGFYGELKNGVSLLSNWKFGCSLFNSKVYSFALINLPIDR